MFAIPSNRLSFIIIVVSLFAHGYARSLEELKTNAIHRPLRRANWDTEETISVGDTSPPDGLGDNSTYDYPDPPPAYQLCKRAFGVRCSLPRPRDCYSAWDRHVQLPLRALTPSQRDTIWTYAKENGAELRRKMDSYVSRKVSRLTEPAWATQDQNAKKFYKTPDPSFPKQRISDQIKAVADCFRQARCPVDGDETFDYVEYCSLDPVLNVDHRPQNVVELGGSGKDSVIISTSSIAEADGNSPEHRAYSSTLTWAAWRQIANDDEYRALKYHMRAWIENDETVNTMTQAHEKFPERVSMEGIPPGNQISAGHGTWKPGDVAFDALLSAPNVKISVNLIIDRNLEMDNPYIAEIHTFGRYDDSFGFTVRHPMIIIKYGPPPPDVIRRQQGLGTIETARSTSHQIIT